jgi:hypothetical protein
MTLRNRTLLTAWLGLIAMWLIVLAPVVSQLVVKAEKFDPAAVLCSVHPSSADTHNADDSGMRACGYCDLLADHVALPDIPPSLPVFVMLVMIAAAAVLSTRFTPSGAFPSGKPRGPPVFSRWTNL